MKTLFLSILTLFIFVNVNAQEDLIKKITDQAVEINNLKEELKKRDQGIKTKEDDVLKNQATIKQLLDKVREKQDSIKFLKSIPQELAKLQKEIILNENKLAEKNDAIALLKSEIIENEQKEVLQIQKSIELAKEEKQSGKNEIISKIENKYKNKPFDSLIKTFSESSIKEDLIIFGQTSENKPLLTDLMTYFQAEKLLENRFESLSINKAQTQLEQINQKSELVSLLKRKLEDYQMMNDGLKQSFEKITLLDQRETVSGMQEEIIEKKRNKILADISQYIFNYDLNLLDYPFLSNAIMEVIKRKQPNPDADISDILGNL